MNIGLKLLLRIIHFIQRDKRKWTWSIKKYNTIEGDEILSKDNIYLTGLKVYHSPNRDEAAENYTQQGGAEDFATRYVYPVIYYTELKKQIKKWLDNFRSKYNNTSSMAKRKPPLKTV